LTPTTTWTRSSAFAACTPVRSAQVVCEPAPGGGSAALAYGLLAALGKTLDFEPPRDPLWRLVGLHLRAERVRHLVVLRAHTLTYLALRRVADHAHGVDARLWLVVHQERPPAAVAQLLEGVPHETAPLAALLALTPDLDDGDTELPAGAGLEFPYLSAIHDLFEPLPRRGVRTTLTRGLSRPDRAAVYRTWDQAHDWMARWLGDRAEWIDQEAADAILALARGGETRDLRARPRRARRLRAGRCGHQRARCRPDLRAQLRRDAPV
jgi:hypothetical protein